MGKLRFRSSQVTGQDGLAGTLGLHSAQDPFLPQISLLALQYERGRGGYVGEEEAPRVSPPCLPSLFAPSGPWECTEIPEEGMC